MKRFWSFMCIWLFLAHSLNPEIVPEKLFIVYAGYKAPIGVTNREFTAVRKLIGTDLSSSCQILSLIWRKNFFPSLLFSSLLLSLFSVMSMWSKWLCALEITLCGLCREWRRKIRRFELFNQLYGLPHSRWSCSVLEKKQSLR